MPVDALSVIARALSFIALFQAAGIVISDALFGARLVASRALIRRYAMLSAGAALVFITAHYLLEAARMAGELSGIADAELQSLVLHSPIAAAFACRAAGLLLISIGLYISSIHSGAGELAGARMPDGKERSPAFAPVSLIGALLVIASFALTGHTTDHPYRWLLASLLVLHLLAVAFWFGGLLPLYLASKHESPATAGHVTERFSALAIGIVPALFLAGACLAAALLSRFAALRTPYGQMLLVKIAGFALLMLLASLNKWRLGPALARGAPQTAVTFRYSLLAEYALISGVLATTAALTTFFSPE